MKVAVLSESPADEAAVRILIQGLLAAEIEEVSFPAPKTRGWKGVLNSVRPALYYLHYSTDADALVVTLDSDESPVHQKGHDLPDRAEKKCRLCQLRSIVADVQSQLRSRSGRGPIKTALGLAVPAVEAWYLVGLGRDVTETAWIQTRQTGRPPYTKAQLKQRVYGTEKPSLALERQRAIEETRRLVEQEKLGLLEKSFPSGFAALADDVRGWSTNE